MSLSLPNIAEPDLYLGLDPGTQGAISIVDSTGRAVASLRFSKVTPHEVADWLRRWAPRVRTAILEHAQPMTKKGVKQGVSSTFKFGKAAGMAEAMLVATGIPYETMAPSKWQGALSCRTKGDKNVTKRLAMKLFPDQARDIVHENADAWLLAEYCRRRSMGLL